MAKKAEPKVEQKAPMDSNLPQQLRTQIAEAEQLRTQMNSSEPPAPTPQEPEPAPAEPAAPAAATRPAAPPPAEEETDAQKLRSAQGRLEQALNINRQMNDRMAQMEQALLRLQAEGVQPPPGPQPPAKPQLVTPEEVADFGEDLLNVVGKRAREEYAPEFEQLASRLRQLETRVDGTTTVIQRTQQQEMYDTLAGEVSNWRDINRSEDFKIWLQHPDMLSGRRRHDLLMEAFSRHETPRVVAFFKGFLTEAAGPPQNPQAREPSAPPLSGNGHASGKPSLEDFAAPGRARSAPQELPPDKPVYTAAWIAKFMADKRTGKYRGREADADAIERDIYQAQHEGRIH
jgi:hypothetical protein